LTSPPSWISAQASAFAQTIRDCDGQTVAEHEQCDDDDDEPTIEQMSLGEALTAFPRRRSLPARNCAKSAAEFAYRPSLQTK
jgi:hypothetical protein